MMVVVWGRNCSACFECELKLQQAGVAFKKGDLNYVLAGTWVGRKHPDQDRMLEVAGAYTRYHRMPIVEVDGKYIPYPDDLERICRQYGS